MIRKFYDLDADWGGSPNYIVFHQELNDELFIKCECGGHLLAVECETLIDTYSNDEDKISKTIYLSVFSNGFDTKSFWKRLLIAFRYIKTGKMYRDNIVLNEAEANRLLKFLEENSTKYVNREPVTDEVFDFKCKYLKQ